MDRQMQVRQDGPMCSQIQVRNGSPIEPQIKIQVRQDGPMDTQIPVRHGSLMDLQMQLRKEGPIAPQILMQPDVTWEPVS